MTGIPGFPARALAHKGDPRVTLSTGEWHDAADGKHFRRLTRDIPALAQRGITAMWIPPAYKGQSDQGNGYGIYGKSPHPSLYVNWP